MAKIKTMFDYRPGAIIGGINRESEDVEGILEEYPTNKSMYEILLEYFPQLNNDFSTWNLVSKSHMLFDRSKGLFDYNEIIKQIITSLRISIDPESVNKSQDLVAKISTEGEQKQQDSVAKFLTEEEQKKFLAKLQSVFRGDKRYSSLSTIEEYINIVEKGIMSANNNQEAQKRVDAKDPEEEKRENKLKDLIIKMGLAVTSDLLKHEIRRAMVFAYTKACGNIIREKYPRRDQLPECPEWDRFAIIEQTLQSRTGFAAYEDFINGISKRGHELVAECGENRSIASIRDAIVLASIDNKPEYGQGDDLDVPCFGDLEWKIEEYDKPELLCDSFTSYKDAPSTNQRVFVVSYGKLHYKMGMLSSSIIQPEIIGVTRVGKDGIQNYFGVALLSSISFRETPSVDDSERLMQFSINGKRANLVDGNKNSLYGNKNTLYGVVSEKIPLKQADDMVNILFSDYHMRNCVELNEHYIGSLSQTNQRGILGLKSIDVGGNERVVLRDAKKTKGTVSLIRGEKRENIQMTIGEYFDLQRLELMQMQFVAQVSNGTIELDQTKGQENRAREEL